MKPVTIDDIGLEIKSELKTLFADRKAHKERQEFLKPLIKQGFEALENKQIVNGCTEKGEWAKFLGCSLRTLQHIAYGRKKNDANTVRFANIDTAQGIILGGVKYLIDNEHGGVGVEKLIGVRLQKQFPDLRRLFGTLRVFEKDPVVTPTAPKPTKQRKVKTVDPKRKTHVERSDGRRGQDGTTVGPITWCGRELEKRKYDPAVDKKLFGSKRAFDETYPFRRVTVVKDHPTCTVCQRMVKEDRWSRLGLCMNEDCNQPPEPQGAYCVPCGRAERIKNGIAEPEDLVPTLDVVIKKDDRWGCEMSKIELQEYEEEFNARRQKEMAEATARCEHIKIEGGEDHREEDCLICFPIDKAAKGAGTQ